MSDRQPIGSDERRGIRFQLSVLLLLSTLNGLALTAVALVMWTTISEDPEPGRQLRRTVSKHVDQVHLDLMVAAATRRVVDLDEARGSLDGVGAELLGWGAEGRDVLDAIEGYRREIDALKSSNGTATATIGADPETRGEVIAGIEDAHASIRASIYALPDARRPAWVAEATGVAPFAIGWVLLLTLVTVYEAFRLRTNLSLPLQRLTAIAREVSAGRLDVDMPDVEAGSEIKHLGTAIRVMRDRLVKSIREVGERSEEMSTILGNLTDGVLHVDSGGRILQQNTQASRLIMDLTGLSSEVGVSVRALLTTLPSDWLGGEADTQRELVFGREGKEHYLLVRTTPVRYEENSGKGGGYVVVLRDVTQSKEVEKLKRDFLSVVTHELKTPLTAIEGYTKLLQMGKAGELTEKQRTFLGTIHSQTNALKTMIQDLLDITRLEAGRLPLSMAVVDPKDMVAETGEAHGGGAAASGLEFEFDSSANGARIFADPFRLQQVLGNLVGNAFKFTARGGKVTVKAGAKDEKVWFTVADTGRGIPESSLPQLFNKFYQVQQDDTRTSGGAGLGLYICRELVEAQGGTIEVSSTVGVGTIFTIRFDTVEAQERADGVTEQTLEV